MVMLSQWVDSGYVLMGVMITALLVPVGIFLVDSIRGKPLMEDK